MTASPIRSLEEAEAWLAGLINLERNPADRAIRLGLGAIEALCARVGDPQRGASALHVAGSKGKGSVCLFAEAILRELGDSVGTFTSPHLEHWTERFRIDGEEIDGASLAAAVSRLRTHVEALRADDRSPSPSFFDATTAAAFLLFDQCDVDRSVFEVGLGGRLDSTNVVEPLATCVTTIELEHTDRLGDTLAKIAFEKAGILKPGVPCVSGDLEAEAMAVVEERARRLGVPLARLGREIAIRTEALDPGSRGLSARGTGFWMRDECGFELEAELPIVGQHQVANAAMAVACVRRLGPHSDAAIARAAPRALAQCAQPARCELLAADPWVVVDSAHTAASAAALANALDGIPAERRHFVLCVSGGKALDAILDSLLPGAASVVTTRAEAHRSMDPLALAEAVERHTPGLSVEAIDDARDALAKSFANLRPGELLCAAGSVYLAGIARSVLMPLTGR